MQKGFPLRAKIHPKTGTNRIRGPLRGDPGLVGLGQPRAASQKRYFVPEATDWEVAETGFEPRPRA